MRRRGPNKRLLPTDNSQQLPGPVVRHMLGFLWLAEWWELLCVNSATSAAVLAYIATLRRLRVDHQDNGWRPISVETEYSHEAAMVRVLIRHCRILEYVSLNLCQPLPKAARLELFNNNQQSLQFLHFSFFNSEDHPDLLRMQLQCPNLTELECFANLPNDSWIEEMKQGLPKLRAIRIFKHGSGTALKLVESGQRSRHSFLTTLYMQLQRN